MHGTEAKISYPLSLLLHAGAVVSMVTATMTTSEGDEATVCANLDSPSGGTSVPITVVFTWSGGM